MELNWLESRERRVNRESHPFGSCANEVFKVLKKCSGGQIALVGGHGGRGLCEEGHEPSEQKKKRQKKMIKFYLKSIIFNEYRRGCDDNRTRLIRGQFRGSLAFSTGPVQCTEKKNKKNSPINSSIFLNDLNRSISAENDYIFLWLSWL